LKSIGKISDYKFGILLDKKGIDRIPHLSICVLHFLNFEVKFFLYDERCGIVTNGVYRGTDGVILVYDVTDQSSYDNLNKWLRETDQHTSPAMVRVLVGNKCDSNQRVVESKSASDFAEVWELPFIETSAKTNANVDQAFITMATKILEQKGIAVAPPKPPPNALDLSKARSSSSGSLSKREKKGCLIV
jgi:Ras-related protein Rab-1A